ncbi:MAG: DUF697 domain-containing protein [Bacteroidota bacterium]
MKKRKIIKSAYKQYKSVKKTIMKDSQKKNTQEKHADTIIRNHVIWSMGAGLIPVLIADIFAVSALQLDMIRQLCKVYDIDFKEQQGKAIVTSLTSSTLARLGARSVVKLIPGIGSLIGGVAVSVFAGASTYALGEVFKAHFESGGTILDFDPERLKNYYREKFEKGKKVARDLKDEAAEAFVEEDVEEILEEDIPVADAKTDDSEMDIITRLKELGQLKESGVITEEEFQAMKKKLIDEF